MKSNLLKTFRWKIVKAIILSAMISVIMTSLLLIGMVIVGRGSLVVAELVDRLMYSVEGTAILYGICWFVIFFILFFVFTQGMVSYLVEISKSIDTIAKGDLDTHVPIKSSDEFGQLASGINSMSFQLKRSMENERKAEQQKNEAITNIAHDLKTPLTSVVGYLGLIMDEPGISKESMQKYVEIAYGKAQKLEKLTNELFEMMRYSDGQMPINLIKLDLVELMEQLTDEFSPAFDSAEMELRLDLRTKPIHIMGDGDLLVRVFDNLINNALRYGNMGKYVDIIAETRNREAVITVTSYGSIIPPEAQESIFDKFYRVENSRSRETGGTGLGLAIAKDIVQMHNGRIRCESDENGTSFIVEFRLAKE